MTSDETIPLEHWLRHLKRYLKVARAGIDPEGVHQVRVATRRLDAWLILGGWKVFRDDLRWLRRRASAVRDFDALLARKGFPKSLRPPMMTLRRQAHVEFVLACEDPRLSALIIGVSAVQPIEKSDAKKQLHRMLDDAIKAGDAAEGDRDEIETLHRLRRALRRLRYGLEFFGESTVPLKKLQEFLGNVNDLSVALRCLDQLPPEKIPVRYRAGLDNELTLSLPLARGLWVDEKSVIRGMVG